MRTYSIFLITFLSFFPLSSYAIDNPKNFPTELLYQNQAIDPLCFDPMEVANEKTSLTTCGIQSEPNEKITGKNPKMLAQGYVGFDYDWIDENGKKQSHGYSYYKAFKNRDNTFTIYTVSSGGGTGQFSSLILAKRQGKQLELKSLAGGDRCNNGIYDVNQQGDFLTYKMNMTPYDFLDLAKQNPRHLAANADLAACATCCIGTATFSRADRSDASNQLVAVRLEAKEQELSHLKQGKYQTCFNRLLTDTKNVNDAHLLPDSLNLLVQKFNAQCV